MADLTLPVAQNLAASLCTIGHPYSQPVINATAMDLIKWCHGAIIEGRVLSAEEQAEQLVEEARLTWLQGWQDKGGTAALRALFDELFKGGAQPLMQRSLTPEDAIARGLIAPPCEACDDKLYLGKAPNLQYCMACDAGRRNAKWNGNKELEWLNRPAAERKGRPVLVKPLTYEAMKAALDDEQRRKREQQAKLDGEAS